MALSLLAVLPPLNNVQRMLETYANKYGSKVWFDPVNASSDNTKLPSVITNIDMLSKIAKQIDQYNLIKRNVKNSFNQRNNQNKVYCIIVLLIIILAIIIYCFVIYMNRYEYFLTDDYLEQEQANNEIKGGDPKEDEDEDECGFFCLLGKYPDMYKLTHFISGSLIFLVIVFYFLFLIYKLYNKSSYAYAGGKTNAHSLYHFDTRIETNTIARVVNLLNDPVVVNAYKHNHPNQPLSSLEKNKSFGFNTSSNIDNCDTPPTQSNVPLDWLNDVTYVPGFDGTKLLDPYVLKKELQSYDFFGQANRISKGVSYLQTQLLKVNDNMYNTLHLTNELRTSINSNIISILTTSAGIIKNPGFPRTLDSLETTSNGYCSGPLPSSTSVNACFTKSMNDKTSPGAIYINNMCYEIPSSGLIINSNVSENDYLVVKSGGRTKFNFEYINIPIGLTQNSCISSPCTAPVCINVNESVPKQYIGTKLNVNQLLNGKGSVSATNVEVDISNDLMIASHVGLTLGLTLTTLKDTLQNNIVNAIIAQDLSKEYTFSKNDRDYITNSIQNVVENDGNSFSSVSGPLTDLLTDLPKLLMKARNVLASNNPVDYMDKYIPFERFQLKITSMDVETFITSFVFFCEEIRASSDGIFNLNSLFYDLIYNNDRLLNSQIRTTSITCLIMVVAFSIISYTTWLLLKPDQGVLQEIDNQKAKLESLKNEFESRRRNLVNDEEIDEVVNHKKDKKKDKKKNKKKDKEKNKDDVDTEIIFKTPDNLKQFWMKIDSKSLKSELEKSQEYIDLINKLTKDTGIDDKVLKEILSGNINVIPDDIWEKNANEIIKTIKKIVNNSIIKLVRDNPKILSDFLKEETIDLSEVFGDLLVKYKGDLRQLLKSLSEKKSYPSTIIEIVLLIEDDELLSILDMIPEEAMSTEDKTFIKLIIEKQVLKIEGLREALKKLIKMDFNEIINIIFDKLTLEQLAIIDAIPETLKADIPQNIIPLLNSDIIDKMRKIEGFKEALLTTLADGNSETLIKFVNGLTDETLKSNILAQLIPSSKVEAAVVATPQPQTTGGRALTIIEKELKRSIADVENEILALRAFTAFKVCASIAIPMMIIAIIAGSTSKGDVVETYNHSIMLNNGTLLVDNASSLLALLYTDIVTIDSYSIKGGSAIFTNDATVINHLNIDVNPWIDNSQNADPPPSQYYQAILQNVTLNSSKKPIVDSNPNNLDTIYSNCINIIESYNKCNSLFILSGGYPFPIIDVTVYGIVLLLTLLVIGLVMSYLKPVKSFKDIKLFNILIEKLENGKAVAKEDMPEELLNWTHDDGILEGKFNSYMIFAAAIFFLVFGIIFTVLASKSGSSMQDVLYASKLYADSECY